MFILANQLNMFILFLGAWSFWHHIKTTKQKYAVFSCSKPSILSNVLLVIENKVVQNMGNSMRTHMGWLRHVFCQHHWISAAAFMINWLFDLSRIQQVLSGCKELTKKRISHKPGLGLLHKFILSADGAHVFLILPPEFQVCQRRSGAAKGFFLPGTKRAWAVWEVENWPFFECLSLVSPTLALSLRSGGDGHIQCTHGEWGIQPATPRKHIFKQERFW